MARSEGAERGIATPIVRRFAPYAMRTTFGARDVIALAVIG